mgnify:CR=1 FL=1
MPFSWFYWAGQWVPITLTGLFYLRREGLSLAFEMGDKGSSAASPLESFTSIVKAWRPRIGYHAALDHYGIALPKGSDLLPAVNEWLESIRTSGELRISNFLLWQISYAELVVTPTLWPDFRKPQFYEALEEYTRRHRRFGGL